MWVDKLDATVGRGGIRAWIWGYITARWRVQRPTETLSPEPLMSYSALVCSPGSICGITIGWRAAGKMCHAVSGWNGGVTDQQLIFILQLHLHSQSLINFWRGRDGGSLCSARDGDCMPLSIGLLMRRRDRGKREDRDEASACR